MFAKKVSKMIERRTNENMKNYGMTLYDAFEEAAHKFAKKGSELYEAWYTSDFRAFIPSAYDAKFLDFEKYPLKYKKENKT